jgi:hypothetical protein
LFPTANPQPQAMLVWHDLPEDKYQLTNRTDEETLSCQEILNRDSTCSAYMYGAGFCTSYRLQGPYCLGQILVVQDGDVSSSEKLLLKTAVLTMNRHVESTCRTCTDYIK